MRRAQVRLRQFSTMVAIAVFVVAAAFAGLPRSHASLVGARVVAQSPLASRLPPDGRRWH